MSAPKNRAPAAMARSGAQDSTNDTNIIAASANAIKARVQAGDLPCVRPTWRTIAEQHVDGLRTRQRLFRICPRQKGSLDASLAGSLAFLAACAWALWWLP